MWETWVGKSPWRRAWQPTPVFLPGESHGQRSLEGYSHWVCKESDMMEWLSQQKHPVAIKLCGWHAFLSPVAPSASLISLWSAVLTQGWSSLQGCSLLPSWSLPMRPITLFPLMSYQLISVSSSSRDIWSQFPCTVSLLNIFFSFLIYQTHSYFNSHSTSFHQSRSERSVCFHTEDTRSSMGSIVRRAVIHLRKRSPSFGPQPSGYPNLCPLTPGAPWHLDSVFLPPFWSGLLDPDFLVSVCPIKYLQNALQHLHFSSIHLDWGL